MGFCFYFVAWALPALLLIAAKLEWGRHWIGWGGHSVNSAPCSKSLRLFSGGCVCRGVGICVCL